MTRYDKPTWQLVEDALDDLPDPFTNEDAVAWFKEHYPNLRPTTVSAHLSGMSINAKTRRNMPSLIEHGILYKLERNLYTRYNSGIHGTFDESGLQRGVGAADDSDEDDALEALTELSDEQVEFALELHLEDFMERNWSQIDFGRALEIVTDDEGLRIGRQYNTGVGPIDFLCRDRSSDALVVVELKKNKTSDQVVGQCQRYMGWVKRHVANEGQGVEGLIVAPEVTDKLRYALDMTTSIGVRCYRVQFELAEPEDTR